MASTWNIERAPNRGADLVFRSLSALSVLGMLVLLVGGFFAELPLPGQLGSVLALFLFQIPSVQLRARQLVPRNLETQPPGLLPSWLQNAEAGAVYLLLAHALLQVTGSLADDLYPLLFLFVAFLSSFQQRKTGTALVIFSMTLEVLLFLVGKSPGEAENFSTVALRCTFLGLFGATHLLFEYTELRRIGRAYKPEREEPSLDTSRASTNPLPDTDVPRVINQNLQTSLNETIELLHLSLRCHTSAFLWLDPDIERLRVQSYVQPDLALAQTLQPSEGILAGIIRRREITHLHNLKSSHRGLNYYLHGGCENVRSFLGVPVVLPPHEPGEDEALFGLLCLDRSIPEPFSQRDQEVARRAAESLARSARDNQRFQHIMKAQDILAQFYEASTQLSQALTPTEVYDKALPCIWGVFQCDFAAVLLTDGDTHSVARVAVRNPEDPDLDALAESLRGYSFPTNNGLVSMAIQLRHALPHRGEYDELRNVVLTRKRPLTGMKSLLVLPLVAQEREVGAFVLAHRQRGAFPEDKRVLAEVIANHVAVSLANARMYEQMEQMATIDGLTGLSNRRHFQQQLKEVIARSERTQTPFSLIITDIDHFKSVNDTYGHPAGDEVLRNVAKTFKEVLRQTDLPARYGGEEFTVILESTKIDGAALIADRLRQEVEALRFQAPQKTFSVSMSFGIAEFPGDSDEGKTLLNRADQALYYAKTHGRNQVRVWRKIKDDLDSDSAH